MLVQVDDRRVFDRFTARFPVKFKDSNDDFGSNVFLRDVCAQGAKIVSKERVYVNDKVELLVELPDGHAPMALNGSVVWARGINPITWDAGIKFDKVDLKSTRRIYKHCQ